MWDWKRKLEVSEVVVLLVLDIALLVGTILVFIIVGDTYLAR